MSSSEEEYSSERRSNEKRQTSIRSFFGFNEKKVIKVESINELKEELHNESDADNLDDDLEEVDSDSFEGEVKLPPKPKRVRVKKQGEYVQCKKQKKIETKGMCSPCYYQHKKLTPKYNEPNSCCIDCMRVAKVNKHGMCRKCSQNKSNKLYRSNVDKQRECKECKEVKFIAANGLCDKCYCRSKPKTKGTCKECGKSKIIPCKDCCGSCYRKKLDKTNKRLCQGCGIIKPHRANGMCRQCYVKSLKTDVSKHKECKQCKQIKLIQGHEMCQACYLKSRRQAKRKLDQLSEDEMRSVSPASIEEDFKLEQLSDSDGQKPGPSWKY